MECVCTRSRTEDLWSQQHMLLQAAPSILRGFYQMDFVSINMMQKPKSSDWSGENRDFAPQEGCHFLENYGVPFELILSYSLLIFDCAVIRKRLSIHCTAPSLTASCFWALQTEKEKK
ncbi:hypothetical protein TNCV_1767311 [Trichonephila clavipes]|nr:hypothetical protein TNCV_1767311 [Trichonephila clavipes]